MDGELRKSTDDSRMLSEALEYNRALFKEERKRKIALETEAARLQRVAERYKSEYTKLMNSRFVKIWLGLRWLTGKPYKRYNESVPKVAAPSSVVSSVNDEFIANYSRLIASIKESNGSGYYKKSKIKVGIITDEFMFNYYKDALELVYLNEENYREVLTTEPLSFVLYVSCWRGLNTSGLPCDPEHSDYYGNKGDKLASRIMEFAKKQSILTIFQTIEDPPNYDKFLPVAKMADIIFTSAAEKIESYKADTGNDSVFLLEYGINPLFHNPIGMMEKDSLNEAYLSRAVLFAGSWYPDFKQRCADTKMIFNGIRNTLGSRLYIADRNFGASNKAKHLFPSEYSDAIIPPFAHQDLQKVHKLFDHSVNVNSVVDSSSMCAMRVYEMQALGCLVISNYAKAVSKAFPGVFTPLNEQEVSEILRGYTERDLLSFKIEGIRNVFSSRTVFDRLNYMFEKAGVDYVFPEKTVYVIIPTGSRAQFEKPLSEQSFKKYCIIEEHEAVTALEGKEGFAVCMREGEKYRHYLLDMANAFKYVDVDYVTYVSEENLSEAFSYTVGNPSPSGSLYNISKVDIAKVLENDSEYLALLKGFTIAREYGSRNSLSSERDLAVIVPVYNNGYYLKNRCFRSLLRSSIFDKMRIYLIDDGSTDAETKAIVKELQSNYSNVETFFFDDGGSGSASRPRNKGVQLCREPFVTFLDPDNEAVSDGYAKLLSEMKRNPADADFAFGSVLFIEGKGDSPRILRYGKGEGVLHDVRQSLIDTKFGAQSMQACVMKRSFLIDNELECIEGAVGEDTLFFFEMAASAKSAIRIDLPIHIYYADRDGSTVNEIGSSFFKKSLACEIEMKKFFEKSDLLDPYMQLAFDRYMEKWYKRKLLQARNDELGECAKYVEDIWSLYR